MTGRQYELIQANHHDEENSPIQVIQAGSEINLVRKIHQRFFDENQSNDELEMYYAVSLLGENNWNFYRAEESGRVSFKVRKTTKEEFHQNFDNDGLSEEDETLVKNRLGLADPEIQAPVKIGLTSLSSLFGKGNP